MVKTLCDMDTKYRMPVIVCLAVLLLAGCGRRETEQGSGGKEPTVLSLTPGGTFNADISEVSVGVECDASWEAAIVSGETWAKILSADKTAGGGTVRVGLEFNMTDDFRTAELKVTSGSLSRTVRILQKSLSSVIDNGSLHFTEPGSKTLNLTTQSAWTASLSDGAEWVRIDPASGGPGATKMTVTVTDENIDKGSRSASIRFATGGTSFAIPVTQGQKNTVVADAERTIRFAKEGGTLTIRTLTNVGRPYVKVLLDDGGTQGAESPGLWLKHLSTRAMDEHVHTFSVDENIRTYTRRADIVFYVEADGGTLADTVTVLQKGVDPILQTRVIGAYDMAGDSWLYRSGASLLSRLYPAGTKTVDTRIIQPADVTVIEIGGVPTDAGAGDTFTVSFRYMQLGETVLSGSHAVSVIKVGTGDEEGLLWLREEDGPGFIVKR